VPAAWGRLGSVQISAHLVDKIVLFHFGSFFNILGEITNSIKHKAKLAGEAFGVASLHEFETTL
jgi:hypothetical protein